MRETFRWNGVVDKQTDEDSELIEKGGDQLAVALQHIQL